MHDNQVKTHTDGIWISYPRERKVVKQLVDRFTQSGFTSIKQHENQNYGIPYVLQRGHVVARVRLIDSVFASDPDSWTDSHGVIVTDNHSLRPVPGRVISALPEFWSIWHFEPQYVDRVPVSAFNCFMNRVRGDRSTTFYELIRRDILQEGLVSYNCSLQELEKEYECAGLDSHYKYQHQTALALVPYNTVDSHGTLEQCIIDSRVSLILETYTSDSHIVFSEKIFRALQLPRPWLFYCSPGSIALLKNYGFDVLDDYVDTSYDNIVMHGDRLLTILDQLETFINRKYAEQDYQRFSRAALHNQNLLKQFEQQWPAKFDYILHQITLL